MGLVVPIIPIHFSGSCAKGLTAELLKHYGSLTTGTSRLSPEMAGSLMEAMRRQYSNCDPCRRSKRRCTFPDPGKPVDGAMCNNCTHLGHVCTFDFVLSRSAPKRRARTSSANVPGRLPPQRRTYFEDSEPNDFVNLTTSPDHQLEEQINAAHESWLDPMLADCLDSRPNTSCTAPQCMQQTGGAVSLSNNI